MLSSSKIMIVACLFAEAKARDGLCTAVERTILGFTTHILAGWRNGAHERVGAVSSESASASCLRNLLMVLTIESFRHDSSRNLDDSI